MNIFVIHHDTPKSKSNQNQNSENMNWILSAHICFHHYLNDEENLNENFVGQLTIPKIVGHTLAAIICGNYAAEKNMDKNLVIHMLHIFFDIFHSMQRRCLHEE